MESKKGLQHIYSKGDDFLTTLLDLNDTPAAAAESSNTGSARATVQRAKRARERPTMQATNKRVRRKA